MPALREALAAAPNTHAARRRRDDARPRARSTRRRRKVVANLPYGIAAGAILRTIEELARRHALGRDGAEGGRRAARRGARQRRLRRPVGARAARLRGARARGRSRAPSSTRCPTSTRCSSCSTRTGPPRRPALRALVQARVRPPPQGARAVARPRGRRAMAERARARARGARARSAIPADARAERLSPEDFARGSRPRTARPVSRHSALTERGAGEDQPRACTWARRASDGRHELVTLMQPVVALPTRVRAGAAPRSARPRDEVVCPGVDGRQPRLAGAARVPRRAPAGTARRCD